QVDVRRFLELLVQVIDDALVEVLAPEERVAVGRLHLEYARVQLQDRDVEGAAAEVVDRDLLGARGAHAGAGLARRAALRLVETVRERRGRRLIDDAQDVEARDAAGVLGGLALPVIEVGGNGDHRFGDLLAEVVRLPAELGITTGSPPSITTTQLLVVPRSMPMTLGIEGSLPRSLLPQGSARSKIRRKSRVGGFSLVPHPRRPSPERLAREY